MICAPKGYYLLQLDLSQAEAWVVAYKCNDRNMKEALTRGDIHSLTACTVNEIIIPPQVDPIDYSLSLYKDEKLTKDQRYVGKKCNHAFNYRMKAERAAQVINKEGQVVVTVRQTKKFYERYHAFYNLNRWWKEIEDKLNIDRTLETVYGFRRTFYDQWGPELFRKATAFEPQSTIADYMFGAVQKGVNEPGGIRKIFSEVINKSNGSIRAINTSHDSIILEVPKACVNEVGLECLSYIKRPMMISGEVFTIPADCEYSERWGEKGEVIK